MKMLSLNWLPTNQQSDQLLELLEWLFATKNKFDICIVVLLFEGYENIEMLTALLLYVLVFRKASISSPYKLALRTTSNK